MGRDTGLKRLLVHEAWRCALSTHLLLLSLALLLLLEVDLLLVLELLRCAPLTLILALALNEHRRPAFVRGLHAHQKLRMLLRLWVHLGLLNLLWKLLIPAAKIKGPNPTLKEAHQVVILVTRIVYVDTAARATGTLAYRGEPLVCLFLKHVLVSDGRWLTWRAHRPRGENFLLLRTNTRLLLREALVLVHLR